MTSQQYTVPAGATGAGHRDENDRGTYGGRFPAFDGLARRHGGVYTEDTDGMTVETALAKANMDYDVQVHEGLSLPVVGLGGVTTVQMPNYRATVRVNRDGSVAEEGFGIVKARYAPVTPRQALEGIGQQILDDTGANIVAVGEYGDPVGTKFYAALQLPNHITIGGQDRHDLFLNLLGSHDGSSSLAAILAPIRLSCTNETHATFNGAAVQKVKVRHTGTPMVRVEEARRVLNMVNTWTQAFEDLAEQMLDTKVTDQQFEDIIKAEFVAAPTTLSKRSTNAYDRKIESLLGLYRNADTQDFGRGTAYGAYNSVVEYADFLAPARGGDQRRQERIMDGQTDRLKEHAWDVFASV